MTRTEPEAGVSSPAMSFISVDLPEPLSPTSPVRPGPTASRKSSRTSVPSGQEKESEVQVMNVG